MSVIRNVPLLQKALEHIDAHPDEWNQGSWGSFTDETACGTACCLAGHIALIDGWEPVREPNSEGRCYSAWVGVEKGGEGVREVEDVAVAALGTSYRDLIDAGDKGYLFSATHTREDLWRMSYELTGGRINLPADIDYQPGDESSSRLTLIYRDGEVTSG